ncbi:MAG TPA: aminoglycoside phosphotransferase family protein [Rhizomicrobium sp.]|nr:aminoglycoside phosphotransferase family protein [Rhizomicrobium sp.]
MTVDAALVARLLTVQFPEYAGLPLVPVRHGGTDNAIFRLGSDKVIRLPRHSESAVQVDKEAAWLPRIAPHLPLATSVPLAKGLPGDGYPFSWTICPWFEGDLPDPDNLADAPQLARSLAGFVRALQAIDTSGGPSPGAHNFWRGGLLAHRDKPMRTALAAARDMTDTDAAAKAWDADMRTPVWQGLPVWIHGDLHPGNLLLQRGRLHAVLDFGGLGVGDPACDLLAAWYLFSPEVRAIFREALQVDDASWARGRGWALSMAMIALPFYRTTSPSIVAISQRVIDAVLADHKANGLPASG